MSLLPKQTRPAISQAAFLKGPPPDRGTARTRDGGPNHYANAGSRFDSSGLSMEDSTMVCPRTCIINAGSLAMPPTQTITQNSHSIRNNTPGTPAGHMEHFRERLSGQGQATYLILKSWRTVQATYLILKSWRTALTNLTTRSIFRTCE